MERGQVIREKVIKNGRYTVKFMKESNDLNHVEVFDSSFGSTPTISFYVSKDLGNYWYKALKDTPDGHDLTNLIDLFFLDSIAYNEDFDFYSDIFKDIYGHRPHYTKSQWENRVNAAKSLKIGVV